ncbi:hypothetical protein GOBAR_AA28527 [Gossypium barbadense]|uniref:DUF4283 domain-containing protein n=1 Tax=Gossypium barbadense TaxID=3634 RepID=A0A2P5WM42_GOSBA|nr:hypothetical protein GOBAR_AA28527 [Gossypium barbadense]
MVNLNVVGVDLANFHIMDEEDLLVVEGDEISVDPEYELCLINKGENPSTVSLWATVFWAQIHNLPSGFITEGMTRQLGDFIGCYKREFLSSAINIKDQKVEFGWDLSLRATLRRGGQLTSKWLREESENEKWENIDIDGENTARRFGVDVTNQREHKGGTGFVGRFMRYIKKPTELRIEGNMGKFEGMRD